MWWDILEIEYTTDEKEIKKAYARLSKSNHFEDDAVSFLKIKDAYEQGMQSARFHRDRQSQMEDYFYKEQEHETVLDHEPIRFEGLFEEENTSKEIISIFDEQEESSEYRIARFFQDMNKHANCYLEFAIIKCIDSNYMSVELWTYMMSYVDYSNKNNDEYPVLLMYEFLERIDAPRINRKIRRIIVPFFKKQMEHLEDGDLKQRSEELLIRYSPKLFSQSIKSYRLKQTNNKNELPEGRVKILKLMVLLMIAQITLGIIYLFIKSS